MASLSNVPNANLRCLKRSFAGTVTAPPLPERTNISNPSVAVGGHARKSKQRPDLSFVEGFRMKGRGYSRTEDMPSATGPRMYENQIPSLMSVYDMDSSTIESPGVDPPSKLSTTTYLSQQIQHQPLRNQESEIPDQHLHSHQYRESTSTQASDSTDSSPTTTISTIDSSSLSDPSPSSSPESPITLVPLSSFPHPNFGLDSFQSLKMVDTSPIRLPLNDDRPMTSPSPRKAKNPKSLALNLNLSVEALQTSETSSPSFIKPPPLQGRRKPSLLSLNTGAANKQSLAVESVPSLSIPTMLQRRGLKHSVSSPQILATPGFGPGGGMNFGERNPPRLLGISRLKESNLGVNTFTINEDHEHPTGPQMATRVPGVTVGGDSFDRPHTGEDAQSPSYPEGPILMHEPSVHLYLEPKIEEAIKFDVIINVAREVKNPFKEADASNENTPPSNSESKRTPTKPQEDALNTATSLLSFQTAFEVQPCGSNESSPTTPKPASDKQIPEYIHVPWDHNTDVKDELWDLCQLIESRSKEGKRVLVHCQQGASRSATLIIAYGMYINPELNPTEAYKQAQAKSRWVNPNMSLLFSLNDFKKVIEQKRAEKDAVRKTTVKHRPTLSADTLDPPPTASRARGNSTPSSSTRDKALAKVDESKPSASISDTTIRRLADFDFGFGDTFAQKHERPAEQSRFEATKSHSFEPQTLPHRSLEWEDLLSPRVAEMTGIPPRAAFSRSYGSVESSAPVPNVFSPTTFEYPRSSFFATLQNPLPSAEDPRSPPTKGEAPITRAIDDFL